MKGTSHFILIIMFLWSGFSFAQDKTISLKQAILELETTFGYTFNYTEETVENYTVHPLNPSFSFAEIIASLQEQTSLLFKILNNKLVSIATQENLFICGYVKDTETQKLIALATVQGRINSIVTDENGYFIMEVSAKNEMITIRYLGYKTTSTAATAFTLHNCATYFISAQTEQLNAVLLSSYLVQGISKMNNGALQVDFDDFSALPGLIETDVLQTVQALPGIQSTNETVSNINIRGGTNGQNLVLWDDIKMYQTGHFFGLISAFNPQITQRVTVQKNGTSATSTDGVSGSIKMETDKQINQKLSGSLGANLVDANVFLDIPLGTTSSLQLGGRKSLSDLVATPTYDAYFARISQDTEVESNVGNVSNTDRSFDFYDISVRLLYEISERDKLRVNFLYIDNILAFNENAILNENPTSRESSLAQNSLGAGILWQREWNENLNTSFQIYESDYNLRAINANILDEQRFLQENSVSETGVKALANLGLQETQSLTFGYEFIESKVTNLDDVDVPLVRTLIAEVVRAHSAFGQYTFQSENKNSMLIAGFRYNYLDKFQESILEPRLRFTQQFLDYFSVEVSGEFKHQITSQIVTFQNDFLGIEKRRWQLSNNNSIPIIKSKQTSLGLNFSNKGWLLSVEGYYKYVDGITTQEQGFQNQFEFIKTSGSYTVTGADVLFRKRLKDISFWLSYSFMNNEYTFENLSATPFPSNYDIPHSVTFGTTYVYDALKVTAGLNWRSGNPTTRPVDGDEIVNGAINYDAPNSNRFADYLRVDSSALYILTVGNTTIEAGVSVWNLLNQTNTISNFYRINEEGNVIENTQNSLCLTPNALLRVTL
jgi:hypothetical protein